MNQQFTPMFGAHAKGFVCSLCHLQRTYGSWEDSEIYLPGKYQSVHLGCLLEHYKILNHHAKLALENARSLLQLIEKTESMDGPTAFVHLVSAGVPILQDIYQNLKGAIRE